RAEADELHLRLLTGLKRHAVVIDHDPGARPFHHGPLLGKIKWHHRDFFQHDVMPDVELGPVRQREYADRLTWLDSGVEQIPKLWTLITRIPGMALRAKREDALLGATLLFIAPRTAEGGVEAMQVERLLQRLSLHHVSMHRRTGRNRADAAFDALLIDVDD